MSIFVVPILMHYLTYLVKNGSIDSSKYVVLETVTSYHKTTWLGYYLLALPVPANAYIMCLAWLAHFTYCRGRAQRQTFSKRYHLTLLRAFSASYLLFRSSYAFFGSFRVFVNSLPWPRSEGEGSRCQLHIPKQRSLGMSE